MSSPIISVKNIGKKYKLGATLGGRNYKTLRDVLTQAAFEPIRKLSAAFRKEPSTSGSHSSPNNTITQSPNNLITQSPNNSITNSPNNPKDFWALKDISFDVQQGEVVGIIGRNGAGKSTLLKILSEITEPTEGEIRIRGRVASLLEVGTGFHGELSGRENIYMNGAILGMTKSEIKSKFDQIVEFAEVDEFIDTPVKRYSSGMYVRLAFAVAAHLEPEILIVDEVLAVGDVAFQKKCLGKMGDMSKGGRTVLFVSHNMSAVLNLCPRAILLEAGHITVDGQSKRVVSNYLVGGGDMIERERKWSDLSSAPGDDTVHLRAIRIVDQNGDVSGSVDVNKDYFVELDYVVLQELHMSVGFQIVADNGTVVFRSTDWDVDEKKNSIRNSGSYRGRCHIPRELLNEGKYSISWVMDDPGRKMIKEHDIFGFQVLVTSNIGGKLGREGVIQIRLPWQTEELD